MKEVILTLLFMVLLAGIYLGGPVSQSMFHFLVVMTLIQIFTGGSNLKPDSGSVHTGHVHPAHVHPSS